MKHNIGIWESNEKFILKLTENTTEKTRIAECSTVEDAKLIAAAPELLEAARKLISYHNGGRVEYSDVLISFSDAITKAMGGT